ncbi:MAG: RagB/SusD family nutrient uptake outer membrane protein [Bacteroidales bacterium]
MKTNKIITYISVLLLAAVVFSCEDFLDVDPQQAVDAEQVYDDHNGVVNALNGAYSIVAGSNFYAGTSIFHSDLVANSGELNWIGTFIQYREMNWKTMDPNDGFITGKWNQAYRAIDIVNNVLDNLEVVNEAQRARVEGEAKFIRGIMYLELVRFFSSPYVAGGANNHDGVPLVLTPTPTSGITEEDYVSRSSVSAVYDQILTDLGSAKTLLTAAGIGTGAGDNGGRATPTTSAAFLARVYMDMEDWPNAAAEANEVINNLGGYGSLNDIPRAAFNNDGYTSEDVFMINQNATSNAGQANDGIGTFFASLDGYGRGDVHISSSHFERFEEGDLRTTLTDDPTIVDISNVPGMYYIGVGTNPGNIMSSKWGKFDANINVIRLAEMILTRAEANFRDGTSIGAAPIADINAIRHRAGLEDLAPANLDLQEIRDERYRELCFEGHQLHDIRRFREDVIVPSGSDQGTVLPWDHPRLVLPIPQREIDVNSNLTQNPGY